MKPGDSQKRERKKVVIDHEGKETLGMEDGGMERGEKQRWRDGE